MKVNLQKMVHLITKEELLTLNYFLIHKYYEFYKKDYECGNSYFDTYNEIKKLMDENYTSLNSHQKEQNSLKYYKNMYDSIEILDNVNEIEFIVSDLLTTCNNNNYYLNYIPYYQGDLNQYFYDLNDTPIKGEFPLLTGSDGGFSHYWKCKKCNTMQGFSDK